MKATSACLLLVGAPTVAAWQAHHFLGPLPVIAQRPLGFRVLPAPVCEMESEKKRVEPTEAQIDAVARASDPFSLVRTVMYVTFGIAGLAGVGISISQMGSNTVDSLGNLAVNGLVLAGGIGIYFFDQSVTAKLREKAAEELANPVSGMHTIACRHVQGAACHHSLSEEAWLTSDILDGVRTQYLKGDVIVTDEDNDE